MPNIESDFLPYSTPEREGVSSDVLLELFREWKTLDSLNSFIIVRRGKVIAEHYFAPYRPEVPHMLFSLTKSFTSLAIGFAEAEGKLSLDAPAADFFPDKTFAQDRDRIRRVTIRHLLTMSGGHDRCPLLSLPYRELVRRPDYVKAFFDMPFVYEPGEKFIYNSGGTHVLAAIVKKVTGMNMTEYLTPRLLAPLGISTFSVMQAPDGVEMGGWGGLARTRDLAKLGQCILQGGVWRGRQIIPAEYLRLATGVRQDNSENALADWKLGYGYQFWRSTYGYRCDGAAGQYAVILPEFDLAFASVSATPTMQAILTALWEEVVPALSSSPLPENKAAQAELRETLDRLAIPFAAGNEAPRHIRKRFEFTPNACGILSCSVEAERDECALTFRFAGSKTEQLRAGFGKFAYSDVRLTDRSPHPTAASAAWTDGKLVIESFILDGTFRSTYTVDFTPGVAEPVTRKDICSTFRQPWEDLKLR